MQAIMYRDKHTVSTNVTVIAWRLDSVEFNAPTDTV